jgi:hypothetical protein
MQGVLILNLALNIPESRRTPNPQLFQVLGFTPTLGQVRVATWLVVVANAGSHDPICVLLSRSLGLRPLQSLNVVSRTLIGIPFC